MQRTILTRIKSAYNTQILPLTSFSVPVSGARTFGTTAQNPDRRKEIAGTELVEGTWRNFQFKMVTKDNEENLLKHLRDWLYFRAMSPVGYDKSMDDDFERIYINYLGQDHNLSFVVEELETGKVVGARVTIAVYRDAPATYAMDLSMLKCPRFRAIMEWYKGLDDQVIVFDKYDVDKYAYLFGISVDPKYANTGLGGEMYNRVIALLRARNFSMAKVSFMSPYSRKIAYKNGFHELGRRPYIECVDNEGKLMKPDIDTSLYVDMGVIPL